MKPIKKKFAKLYIAILTIVLAVAAVFCFVPMKWGNSFYNSFIGDLNFASDLQGGYYAEYKIVNGNTDTKIEDAASEIQKVLTSKGYTNANIYAVNDNETLRVEISAPNGGQTATDAISTLQTIGVGAFEIKSSTSDDAVVLSGSKYVSGVSVKNYNGQVMAYIEFNDAGQEKYKELVAESDKLYIYLGGNMQTSFDAEGIVTYDSLPLTFTDAATAENFKVSVILGSLPIELDASVVEINTMSSTIGNGSVLADPNASEFLCTNAKLLVLIALAVILLISLVYMIVRFKVLGLLNLIAFLAEAIIMVIMLWAIPTIELSITGVLAIIAGTLLININKLCYFNSIESERKLGKTITASLETAYKKSLPINLISGAIIAVIAAVFAIFTIGAIQVASLIILIAAIVSIIMSIGFLPLLVNIFEAFNKGEEKAYGKIGGKN